jgi:hypothetical protein
LDKLQAAANEVVVKLLQNLDVSLGKEVMSRAGLAHWENNVIEGAGCYLGGALRLVNRSS